MCVCVCVCKCNSEDDNETLVWFQKRDLQCIVYVRMTNEGDTIFQFTILTWNNNQIEGFVFLFVVIEP